MIITFINSLTAANKSLNETYTTESNIKGITLMVAGVMLGTFGPFLLHYVVFGHPKANSTKTQGLVGLLLQDSVTGGDHHAFRFTFNCSTRVEQQEKLI